MSRGAYLIGLDIGTTKVAAIVASANRSEILAVGVAPSLGVKKGVVVDMDATVDSIKRAVLQAETDSGVEIKNVYAGLAGSHIQCQESFGATGIRGKVVRDGDLRRVMDSASTVYVPLDREILHVIPSEYVIDGQDGITQPLGMSGVRLEVKVNIITAARSAMENVKKCCELAGLRVSELVMEPLASAEAVLDADELEQGVLLVDIGGGTTDLALFKEGALRHASVLAVGGAHFTSDLSIGLRVAHREAEELKKRYTDAAGAEGAEATSLNGETRPVSWRQVGQIITPRTEELFSMVKNEMHNPMLRHKPVCAVLTGGASLLKGLDRVAEASLGLPVRLGAPSGASSAILRDISTNPVYSTGVGLAQYGGRGVQPEREEEDMFAGVLGAIGGWFENALRIPGWRSITGRSPSRGRQP